MLKIKLYLSIKSVLYDALLINDNVLIKPDMQMICKDNKHSTCFIIKNVHDNN